MAADCAILERRCVIMGNDLSNSGADENSKGDNSSRRWEKAKILKIMWPIVCSTISAVIALSSVFIMFGEMNANIKNLQDDVTEIKADVKTSKKELENNITKLDSNFNVRIRNLWEHVLEAEGENPYLVEVLIMESSFQQKVIQDYGVVDQYSPSSSAVETASYILYSPKDSEIKYTAEDVAQKKLLLPYKNDGQECFFYGQLDEQGNWDGDCVINIYRDKKLELITEANYDGGVLKTFRQAFPGKLNGGRDIWYFSKRTMEQGYSRGETWDYFSSGDYQQEFAYEDVIAEDIMDIDSLKLKVSGLLEGYYNGNTSAGRFNDNSGEAYMVKYFEDGTVRTLYVGKFENGFPEDSADSGWLIGRSNRDGAYSYYKGPFKEGHPSISSEAPNAQAYWDIGISQEDIDRLLAGRTFNCELTWFLPSI